MASGDRLESIRAPIGAPRRLHGEPYLTVLRDGASCDARARRASRGTDQRLRQPEGERGALEALPSLEGQVAVDDGDREVARMCVEDVHAAASDLADHAPAVLVDLARHERLVEVRLVLRVALGDLLETRVL